MNFRHEADGPTQGRDDLPVVLQVLIAQGAAPVRLSPDHHPAVAGRAGAALLFFVFIFTRCCFPTTNGRFLSQLPARQFKRPLRLDDG